MFRSFIACCAFIFSTIVVSNVYAEACTYSEAMMAFKSGNAVRGQALMKIAARDGDSRAVAYLASGAEKLDQFAVSGKAFKDALVRVSASTNAPSTAQQAVVQKTTAQNVVN
ncbi:MAG: hypothetical protein PVJ39_08650 [Gammaproteobacteria bacterium]|jgi:hypothetical protein